MRGFLWCLLLSFTMSGCNNLQKKYNIEWQNGDLLFQDLDDSSLSEAIENVTGDNQSLSFSHVGMVMLQVNGPVVLEAISKGVSETPLDSFLMRSVTSEGKPKVMVARLKKQFQDRIPQALEFGQKLIGYPYDMRYVMGDSSYYCSELIYEMIKNSGDSSDLFKLFPMTFKDPETGVFNSVWVEYYQMLGVEIPEGEPGLNPNGMSRSDNIEMVYNFAEDR